MPVLTLFSIFQKRLSVLKNSITAKEPITTTTTAMPIQSTIIVQPPKRTNSISSTTSTISHTSDSALSCADSPPPNISTANTQNNGPTMDELTESAIKTLNAGLLAKSNALALKNRKVYMITEKCDDAANGGNSNSSGGGGLNGSGAGQKRKMYLIMEEKESEKLHGENAEKLMKAENTNGSKKLTLFTDTTNGQLPQKFEKILPEILNCIQAKKGGGSSGGTSSVLNGKTEILSSEQNNQCLTTAIVSNDVNSKFQLKTENNERLPLTLPPKKNRTKIITTQIIPVNPTQHAIYQGNGIDNWSASAGGVVVSGIPNSGFVTTNSSNGFCKPEKSSGATPVIVNASSLLATNNGNGNIVANGLKIKENVISAKTPVNQLHKNINLSTDFLFLMKMLPKLESIEEPQKTYVKTCIEDIINQYATNQIEEQ